MKRSEMLRAIHDALYMKKIDGENFQEQILSTVETFGMCPPFSAEVFLKQKQKWGIEAAHGNEWEQENDENN